jgi:hypothetical protein
VDIKGNVVTLLSHLEAWFASIRVRIGNIVMFNRTYNYYNELVVVSDTIEYFDKKLNSSDVAALKRTVKRRMEEYRLSRAMEKMLDTSVRFKYEDKKGGLGGR